MDNNNPEEDIRRKEIRRTRYLLSLPAIIILAVMDVVNVMLYIVGLKAIALDIPLFTVMGGFLVIFFGSFYDFGARKYIDSVMTAKVRLREEDIKSINREQLIMNVFYIGIGLLYIISGFVIYYALI